MPVAYSSSIIARSRRPRGVATSGCAMSASTSSTERNFGSAGQARGGCRSSAGLSSQAPVEDEKAEEARESRRPTAPPTAARARCVICWRTNASSALRSSASGGTSTLGRERRERRQIPRVALERVVGQPPLDPQVIEIGKSIDHVVHV